MNKYSKRANKILENGIAFGIALTVGLVIYCVEQTEKKYISYIIIGLMGTCITIVLVYYVFRFLDKREERWVNNDSSHKQHVTEIRNLKIEIENQKSSIDRIKQEIAINKLINLKIK